MRRRLLLIGGGAQKRAHPARAEDLYTGALFVAQRAYAQASGEPWAILSACHGLVLPDRELAPYNEPLPGLRAQQRTAWARDAVAGLFLWQYALLSSPRLAVEVEILAGAACADALRHALSERNASARVTEPLRGLRLGHRRRWLIAHTPLSACGALRGTLYTPSGTRILERSEIVRCERGAGHPGRHRCGTFTWRRPVSEGQGREGLR